MIHAGICSGAFLLVVGVLMIFFMQPASKRYDGAGVYVVRCRRPGLLGRLKVPFLSWHIGYVGQGLHVYSRQQQHRKGSMKYGAMPQPWSDLSPKWYVLPLPPWRAFLLVVEGALIFLLQPVYNHSKNLANLRRIPLTSAKRQRAQRDLIGWCFNLRPAHMILWGAVITIGIARYGA